VDWLVSDGTVGSNEDVFRLNTFELDRETFKLLQELEFSKLTAARLEQQYVDELVFKPLNAAQILAKSDLDAAKEELEQTKDRLTAGEVTRVEVSRAMARLAERKANLGRSETNLAQRKLEIEQQTRRLIAEQTDLASRIRLNQLIRDIHVYRTQRAVSVETHTHEGAFVEEGDPICTIRR
jgi:chromosome segregation ATPase